MFYLIFLVSKITCFDYKGYSLYDINVTKESDLEFFKILDRKFENIDYLHKENRVGGHIQMFIEPRTSKEISMILNERNFTYIVTTKDNWFPESEERKHIRNETMDISLDEFNSYEDIIRHLKKVVKENKEYLNIRKVGESYEKRDIYCFTIGYSSDKKKPILFLENNIHAREWVTLSSHRAFYPHPGLVHFV
uniref:Peptidase_M14 domain-containing protein n=1 Tax=Parastrongyloides trichosuri TaxID=131310 RepID=A0A0N4ZLN4_PARTI